MKFNCEECNFRSNNKSNYNRHLKSKKHISICENMDKEENILNITKNKFTCKFCGKILSNQPSYSRHVNRTCKKRKKSAQEVKEQKNKVIKENENISITSLNMMQQMMEMCNKTVNALIDKQSEKDEDKEKFRQKIEEMMEQNNKILKEGSCALLKIIKS